MTEQLMVSSGDILVLVGTTKGAFLFRTDPEHERTEVTGPHFPGEAIYSLAYDDRAGRRRVLAGCACTRCWWTPTTPSGSGSPSRRGASTTPKTAASPGARGTRGSGH